MALKQQCGAGLLPGSKTGRGWNACRQVAGRGTVSAHEASQAAGAGVAGRHAARAGAGGENVQERRR